MGRRLGQHFLHTPSVLRRISEAACPAGANLVVEVGPGRGALTGYLLERAERLVAVEVDPVLVAYLRQKFRDNSRVNIVEADVLGADLGQWGPAYVCGNLPYYITSPILTRVFGLGSNWLGSAFLVQREVAERLTAEPGSRDFGFLTVQTHVYSRPEYLFTVPPGAFKPPPKVDSAVVRLTPRDALADFGIGDVPAFLRFAGVCFRHKRKTLRNNLSEVYSKPVLEGVPHASARAEQLPIPQIKEVLDYVVSRL